MQMGNVKLPSKLLTIEVWFHRLMCKFQQQRANFHSQIFQLSINIFVHQLSSKNVKYERKYYESNHEGIK